MSLASGTRIGSYEVTAQIGVGGMGEVYRGTDTNLKRQVAIKVLPAAVAADADRVARFQREAEVLAQLNHPNIAQIHGFERSDGVSALVMELVEGPTLADRIAQGAMPVDDALPIAKQIVEALEAAHEQGIVHRDLKPANIKVRDDGTVKVLDFGLAKAIDPTAATSPAATNSPTLSLHATQAGIILGTAAYMSPEQARGKAVDRRADIWAFGAVLFEMLTGRRAFDDEDVSLTLSKVLQREPDFDLLPASVPARVTQVLRLCLRKDPKQRVSDIRDVRLGLDGAFETAAPPAPTLTVSSRPLWQRVLPVAGASIVTALVAALAGWILWPTEAPAPVSRFRYPVPEGQAFRGLGRNIIAISPDGRRFVYNTDRGLYLRGLDELDAHVIPGTEAQAANPFFSPDGQSVGYWGAGQLKRLSISGGVPTIIGAANNPFGVSWGRDGAILFGSSEGILRVPATGGTPAVVVPAQAGEQLGDPQMLPDGDSVLFHVGPPGESFELHRIAAQRISTGERKVLVESGTSPRYLTSGHLVFTVGNVLMGVAFDARRLTVTGSAVPLVPGVSGTTRGGAPVRYYAVAADGTLVWVYTAAAGAERNGFLALTDGAGKVTPLSAPAGAYEMPRVSPDGTRVALGVPDPKESYIAIYDLDGRTALRRLTFGGNSRYPVWSRDGQRVAFQSDREGDRAIFWQRADGSTAAERLTKPEKDTAHVPASWSPKDETLLFTVVPAQDQNAAGAVWTYTRASGAVAPFGGVDAASQDPMFSPDGRWVAYASRTGLVSTTYIQPFPPTGARYELPRLRAESGGNHPFWSSNGKMLYFVPSLGELAVANVTTQPTVTFGNPALVPRPFLAASSALLPRLYDILPDGRFIGLTQPTQAAEIHIVLNWVEELKRLVPTK